MSRRSFTASACALVVLWAAISIALWRRERSRALEEFSSRAVQFVTGLQLDIAEAAREGREDMRMLVTSAAADALRRNSFDSTPMLQQEFLTYLGARSRAFQARLIGADGLERIRVERRDGKASIALETQDKSSRHYFVRASELPPGQVYVSPLDLNVEHGRIEVPHRPTLRFSAPMHDDAGQLVGVVVVNWEAAPLLERFERARGQIPGTLVLVHRDGEYVSHPDLVREWGNRGLARDYPQVASWLERGGSAIWAGNGVIAARGPAPVTTPLPRVLLITPEDKALAAGAGALLALTIGIGVAAVGIAIVLFLLWRHRRVVDQLRRESLLRREIAHRESRLTEAHDRLVASARLAALAESAAALAHEVRNPLGAIVNSAAQLTDDPDLDDDGRKLMQIVLEESERLERAVAEFLALARRRPSKLEPVDLLDAARRVVELARRDPAIEGAVDIVDELDEGAPPVLADADEVRQVLWNLLLNAGKATRRAGGREVIVRVFESTLAGRRAAVLEVEDEGPGPPSDDDDPAAVRPTGTGLGLIVAAGIVARYGGQFELVARANRSGACARVVLPSPTVQDAPAMTEDG